MVGLADGRCKGGSGAFLLAVGVGPEVAARRQGIPQERGAGAALQRPLQHLRRRILETLLPLRQDDDAFDGVLQLTHVSFTSCLVEFVRRQLIAFVSLPNVAPGVYWVKLQFGAAGQSHSRSGTLGQPGARD